MMKFWTWLKSLFVSSQAKTSPSVPTSPASTSSMPITASNFEYAFHYTVGNEGGFSNDAADHGGATKYGITHADLAAYLGHSVSTQDVKDMSLETAKNIYRNDYWDSLSLGQVGSPEKATCMFDIGVVMGIGKSAQFAQEICSVAVDKHIGPMSVKAINAMNTEAFVRAFSAKAEARFRSLGVGSQQVFLKGWVNRARRLLTLVSK